MVCNYKYKYKYKIRLSNKSNLFFILLVEFKFKKQKKRYPDSHRSTVTTQTQNKTRQNYYAILPVYAGEAYGRFIMGIHICIWSFRLICIIINVRKHVLFNVSMKKGDILYRGRIVMEVIS